MVLSPALFVIVALLVAGQVAARLEALPANAPDTLNRFALYVALPAQILLLVPKLTPKPELAVVALTPWLLLGLSIAMVLAAARVFRFREEVTSALLICVPLGNTSFLGFPMVLALLGEDAMPIAVVYDQLGSFVILSTYALIVVARRGGGENPTFASVAKRVLTFPPCIAFLIAVLPITWSPVVEDVLAPIAASLVPVAMFGVGFMIRLRVAKDRTPLVFGIVAKMVVLPLAAFAIARAFALPRDATAVVVFESAMPSMISAGALAAVAGFAPELCAAIVGYGILVSFVTLPIVAMLVGP